MYGYGWRVYLFFEPTSLCPKGRASSRFKSERTHTTYGLLKSSRTTSVASADPTRVVASRVLNIFFLPLKSLCFNFIFRTKFTGVEQKSAPVPVWGKLRYPRWECREKVDASIKIETGESSGCIIGCAGWETWGSNRINTLQKHSTRCVSTSLLWTNLFGPPTYTVRSS